MQVRVELVKKSGKKPESFFYWKQESTRSTTVSYLLWPKLSNLRQSSEIVKSSNFPNFLSVGNFGDCLFLFLVECPLILIHHFKEEGMGIVIKCFDISNVVAALRICTMNVGYICIFMQLKKRPPFLQWLLGNHPTAWTNIHCTQRAMMDLLTDSYLMG